MPDEVKLVERVARAMFDCYRGYDAATQEMLWQQSRYGLERQAESAIAAIEATRPTAATDDVVKELVEALDRIADVWTLQARVQPTDRKWHCQHEEWLSAAVEEARRGLAKARTGVTLNG